MPGTSDHLRAEQAIAITRNNRSVSPEYAADPKVQKPGRVEQCAGQIFTGFQTRAPAKLYRGYWACEASILAAAGTNTANSKANSIEVYEQDALNPDLAGIPTDAHNRLPPPP